MARRTQEIKAPSFAGIERGLARGEAREQRAEDLAREDARIEQERLDRQVQQGFQAVGAQQRQQGIDIQQQQLEASIQQRQAEFDAQQQEIVDAREERQSQANISNSISIADAMLKAPGIDDNTKRKILKTIAGEMDDVFAGVDLNAVDSSKVLGDLIPLWKEFEKGKLTTEQLFISTSLIAAQNKESQEATQLSQTAGTLLTQEGLKERSEIAAGGGADKNTTQFRGFIKDISARLAEVDLDNRPVLPAGSERRRRQEERLDFYQGKVDESFGFAPRPVARQAPIPAPSIGGEAATVYTFEEYKSFVPGSEKFDDAQLKTEYERLVSEGKLNKQAALEAPGIAEEALGFVLDDTTPEGKRAKQAVEKAVEKATPVVKKGVEDAFRDLITSPLSMFDPTSSLRETLGVNKAVKKLFLDAIENALGIKEEEQ